MVYTMVNKMYESAVEIERSMRLAKRAALRQDPVPLLVLKRIAEVEEILDTQKKLALKTADYLSNGQFDEVHRATRLISGFSTMIHDDARQILEAVGMPTLLERRA